MIEKTVYLIGAGASKEAGLPTGAELKDIIARMLDFRSSVMGKPEGGDYKIINAIELLVLQPNGQRGNISPYLSEARHIKDALPQAISIDNFIDSQRGNDKLALCGKLGIVRSILDAENKSHLFVDMNRSSSNINFNILSKTWYDPFFKQITENCTVDELGKRFRAITLIIFNYDRCVEHFLYYALQNYYRINGEEAAGLIKNIKIYHPYGAVGELPWVNKVESVEFGLDPHPEQLLNIVSKIKTFTEGTDPASSEIISIHESIDRARRLVFLGFAFHKLNMQLITPENIRDKSTINCFATAFEVSENDQQVIEGQIRSLHKHIMNVNMSNTKAKCYDFFTEFWRSLAF